MASSDKQTEQIRMAGEGRQRVAMLRLMGGMWGPALLQPSGSGRCLSFGFGGPGRDGRIWMHDLLGYYPSSLYPGGVGLLPPMNLG